MSLLLLLLFLVLVLLGESSVTALQLFPPSILGGRGTRRTLASGTPSSIRPSFGCNERYNEKQFQLSSSSVPLTDVTSTSEAPASASDRGIQDVGEENNFVPITFHTKAVVCGAGPAGLLTAIMLAQRLKNKGNTNTSSGAIGTSKIHVVECRQAPKTMSQPIGEDPHRATNVTTKDSGITPIADAAAYSVRVFGRGKLALERFGLWDTVVRPLAQELVGSQTWRSREDAGNNNTMTFFADSGRESIYSLPRDTLVSALYQHILETYPDLITFHFSQQLEPVSFK